MTKALESMLFCAILPLNKNITSMEHLIMEDRWLSLKEITEYLGIRRETVYRWIEQREMPGHRIGKLWKFKKDEVDAWVKSGKAADAEVEK